MKLNHDDVWNLNVVNLSGDDLGVVDAVNFRCVEVFVNVKLSEDDVHLDDANVVEEVYIVEDDVIGNVVVIQDVDVRVDA